MKSNHRKFNGKLYMHWKEIYGKTNAEKEVKKYRKRGYNARVTPQSGSSYFDIWIIKKKKRSKKQ